MRDELSDEKGLQEKSALELKANSQAQHIVAVRAGATRTGKVGMVGVEGSNGPGFICKYREYAQRSIHSTPLNPCKSIGVPATVNDRDSRDSAR